MTSMMGMMGNTGASSGQKMTGMNNIIPKGYKQGQLQQFTPEQMQLFQQLFSNVGPQSYLSRLAGGDEGLFEEMEAPAHRQFQGKLGEIASRFSGYGMGGRRSSGFNLESTQAASNFSQDLSSKRQELQRQALMDLMNMSNSLLGQRPYEQSLIKKQAPFWQQLLLGINEQGKELAGAAGKAAMMA